MKLSLADVRSKLNELWELMVGWTVVYEGDVDVEGNYYEEKEEVGLIACWTFD